MATLALSFEPRDGPGMTWEVNVTPRAIADLRTVPQRLPAGFVPAGSTPDAEIQKCVQLLLEAPQQVYTALKPDAASALHQAIAWWALYGEDHITDPATAEELQRRCGHEDCVIQFRRTGKTIETALRWGKVEDRPEPPPGALTDGGHRVTWH